MAKLYFRYGAMGSSKTANAIMVRHNYLELVQKVLMLKPRLDNRDGETIVASRCGLKCECAFIEDLDQFVPVALMLIAMPISGSIGHAIGLGLISYTFIKVLSGKAKDVSILTYVISLLFLVKFFLAV